ncbi:TIGR04084 family radical SAM/SPASM domain-containing protein [Myxococcota bacterium]|nr:TIGR04084 family radical SAM/SPASM domain-containing protein [Myxococcota bacterium]
MSHKISLQLFLAIHTDRIDIVLMYYLVLLTKYCNLECDYCDAKVQNSSLKHEEGVDVEALAKFLNADPDLGIQFYGGEPLLRIDLMEKILERVNPKRVVVQTNGFFLDQIPTHLYPRIDVISLSLDGPARVTDSMRGVGVYERLTKQALALREKGYQGSIDARMTTTPGVSVYQAVRHLWKEAPLEFDAIYWQLNVEFFKRDWVLDKAFIKRWFKKKYNPEITKLIDEWVEDAEEKGRLKNLVPFTTLMHDLITGRKAEHVRCGAGAKMWSIAPKGDVYPCPVMVNDKERKVLNINEACPSDLHPVEGLYEPCEGCEVRDICGGRCIYTTVNLPWGEEGFRLVCSATKHLINELKRVQPRIQKLVDDGVLDIDYYGRMRVDYEVIP